MNNYRKKQNQQTLPEILVIGIFNIIAGIIKLIFKGFAKKRGLSTSQKTEIIHRRHQIEQMLVSNNIHELSQAVFEADKLVDHLLQSYGYEGQNFADRLRHAEQYLDRNLCNQIWQGHKVRNLLAHDHDHRPEAEELRRAAEKLLRYIKTI